MLETPFLKESNNNTYTKYILVCKELITHWKFIVKMINSKQYKPIWKPKLGNLNITLRTYLIEAKIWIKSSKFCKLQKSNLKKENS